MLCDGDDVDGLTIASGTVFNKILLWRVTDQPTNDHEAEARMKVHLKLAGHEARRQYYRVICVCHDMYYINIGCDILY